MRRAFARTGPTRAARLPLCVRPDCRGGVGHAAGGPATGRGGAAAIATATVLEGASFYAVAIAAAVFVLLGRGPSAGHARAACVPGPAGRLHSIVGRDVRSGFAGAVRSDGSRRTDGPGKLEVALGERGRCTPVPGGGGCGGRPSPSPAARLEWSAGRC